MQLSNLTARKILNSRKEVTIAVIAETHGKKIRVEASAPSGASKGRYEVKGFSSRGIDFSIDFVNVLGRKLVSEEISFELFQDLEKVEDLVRHYDRTPRLEFIGGNALYAFEAAILKAMARAEQQEPWQFLLQDKKLVIPRPLGNCIGGGMHIKQTKKTDFQEFLLLPRAKKFFDAYFANLQAYKEAKFLLQKKDIEWNKSITDENALASTLDNESVLTLLQEVREAIKDKFNITIDIGIDAAAATFFIGSKYRYKNFSSKTREKALTKEQQIAYMAELIKDNNLCYVEDPLQSTDFEGFAKLHAKTNALICGDDLTCTHLERLKEAIKTKAINALIVKPNQIGSLIETKKVLDLAKKNDIIPIISHRSGETQDDLIADLAAGWQVPIIKTGIIGKERFAKLHRLLRIERELS